MAVKLFERKSVQKQKETMLRDDTKKVKHIDVPDRKSLEILRDTETARICLERGNKEHGMDLELGDFTPIEVLMLVNKYKGIRANYMLVARETGLRILFGTEAGLANNILLFSRNTHSIINTNTGYKENEFKDYPEELKGTDGSGVFKWCKERGMYDIAISEKVHY